MKVTIALQRLILLSLLGVFLAQLSYAQGWLKEYGGPANQNIYDFVEMPDGGMLFVGGTQFLEPNDASLWIGRTNVHRQLVWETSYPYYPGVVGSSRDMIQPLANGNFRVLAADPFNWDAVLIDIGPQGVIDTTYTLINTGEDYDDVFGMATAPSDGTVVLKRFAGRPVAVLLDSTGNEVWWTQLGNTNGGLANVFGYGITTDGQDNYFVGVRDYHNDQFVNTIVEVDNNGVVQGQIYLPDSLNFNARDLTMTPDQGFVITGYTGSANNSVVKVVKLDAAGDVVWEGSFLNGTTIFDIPIPYAVDVEANGDILVTGSIGPGSNAYDLFVLSIGADGSENWHKTYDLHGLLDISLNIKATDNGNVLLCGATNSDANGRQGFLMSLDGSTGDYYTHFLRGRVAVDVDSDCEVDLSETAYQNMPVTVAGQFETYYASTDGNGFYEILLDTGDYVVSISAPEAWGGCDNDVAVSIQTFYDETTVDFALQAQYDCTEMTTEIGVPFLRICDTTAYTVSYCNYGTIAADSAYVEVFLDTNLVFLDASIPLVSVDSNRYEFDLGAVASLECGHFTMTVSTPCDVDLLGQFFCTSAFIYPDDNCTIDTYAGPVITLDGTCEADSIQFLITNTGGDMLQAAEYIVIEDNIILMEGAFDLDMDESQTVKVPSLAGAVYHLLAAQAESLPSELGHPIAAFTVAACDGTFNSDDFLAFAQNNVVTYLDLNCQPLIGAYDPNDKQATPTGWREEHYIDRGVALDYKIRFQNTGTDTAFHVVIVDTLSTFLDPGSIEFGTSSHDYRAELLGEGILRFTFSNIMLPDSNINEAASHGFVEFRIAQQPDLPYDTRIENFADIYFDFNPPIRTNTTFHTIQPPLVSVITSTVDPAAVGVERLVGYPNPAFAEMTIELQGDYHQGGRYELFNLQGQRIGHGTFSGDRMTLSVDQLPVGVYSLRLSNADMPLGVVRVMVSR